jgi:hypothetical protein
MLSIYKAIANNRVIDNSVYSEFTNDIRAIERTYNLPPIDSMNEYELGRLEYQLVGNYAKSLAKVYECYDKLIGLKVVDITETEVGGILEKMTEIHTKSIFTTLANVNSLYNIVPATMISNYNTKHFLSRYSVIIDMKSSGCCSLI